MGNTDSVGGGSGVEAIQSLLRGDPPLVDAALIGLRGVIDRSDIPNIEEVLRLRDGNRVFYVSFPFLVGMAELDRTEPERLDQLSHSQICKAVTFYHSSPQEADRPDWYRRVLSTLPEIVADVQMQFAVSDLRGNRDYVHGVSELAYDEEFAQVARLVSLPLLRAFPARSRLKQSEALESLLVAAIQHADRSSLRQLIARKCKVKSMDVAQRARWLAAGLITSPDTYLGPAEQFTGHSERRIRHLTALFQRCLSVELDIPVMSLLVRLAGSSFGPDKLHVQGWVTPAMEGSRLVSELIQRVASSPESDATQALEDLAASPALRDWNVVLSRARDSQKVIRRDASYRHPTLEQVCAVLNGATPANAGDLAALLVDRLEEVARQIRTANTDDWRQYWNEDSHGRPMSPKHEDHCRDALLSDLRQLFPDGVDAQPEGQYVNDRRADIRVAVSSDFHVPVEVKKNMNRDLWRGIKDQLIDGYAREPATDGFGIYVVFWFGPELTQTAPDGSRPDGPDKLREMLRARLAADQARKISVCVIDVSAVR